MVRAVGSGSHAQGPSFGDNKPSKEVTEISTRVTKAAASVTLQTGTKKLSSAKVSLTSPSISQKVSAAAKNLRK